MAAKTPETPEPPKNEEPGETVTVKVADLQALLARIEKLEREPAELEITTELPQAAALQPGQYVNIAPPAAAPDLRKVRWSKGAIEKTYPSITFVPLINIVVAPHGIPYHLTQSEPVTVPSIVRDFHDTEFQRQKHFYDRYRPESALEVIEGIQRSKEQQGVPIWGRLHLVGSGLLMGESSPAVQVPEKDAKA